MPDLPPDIPRNVTIRTLLMDNTPAGQDAVWTTPDGVLHEFFQFNDRGRGPKTYTDYRIAGALPVEESTRGVDYMKTSVQDDEIQHMNFIFLNFMPDVKETRTPARFTEPGRRAASIDVNGPDVASSIALLKEHHTVIYPTLATCSDIHKIDFVVKGGKLYNPADLYREIGLR
jgi:hypothetical protein